MRNSKPVVMVFAATDGSGGAGLLADYRVLTRENCLPLSVITAVTAQNLNGVAACWRLSAARVRQQFLALSTKPAIVKIGVVGGAAATIGRFFNGLSAVPVVFDPVLSPSQGRAFSTSVDILRLQRHILPHVYVMTPNRQELLRISGETTLLAAVKNLSQRGVAHVMVTDIVGRGKKVHHVLLAGGNKTPLWEASCHRRQGLYHGSGCFLSSTLAARLAHGDSLAQAAQTAHDKTIAAIDQARSLSDLGKQYLLD